jgi:Ulp1 protease family, C-terminal catalytic domain
MAGRLQALLCMKLHFFTKFTVGWDAQPGVSLVEQASWARRAVERVWKWTEQKSLLSYNHILVPLHAAGYWSLAVICNPEGLLPPATAPAAVSLRRCRTRPHSTEAPCPRAGSCCLPRAAPLCCTLTRAVASSTRSALGTACGVAVTRGAAVEPGLLEYVAPRAAPARDKHVAV